MDLRTKDLLPVALLLAAAALLAARSALPVEGGDSAPAAVVERAFAAMGTRLELRVEAAERLAAVAASEAAVRALEAVEARLSTWREGSELARLNAAPVGEPFLLSAELERDLRAAQRWHAATGGGFDPGIGALVSAWALRSGGRIPSEAELRAALDCGGFAALELAPGRAMRRTPALALEEGGFGKGVGLDAALAALRASGARAALLDLGGQVAVLPDGRRFDVLVAHPRERALPVAELAIETGSIATSGNSERGIEIDGQRIGHLLDPRTGRPAGDFGSLSVWAPEATAADCLSTGLYVLGADAALELAARLPGVEVLVLELRAGGLRARASAGLEGRLRALVDDLPITFHPFEEGSSH